MKKIFLFLSILMFSLVGVFVACNDDPYADLKVVVSSVAYKSTGNAVEYDSATKSYILYYNDEIVINASATCSKAISSALEFKNYNENSIETTIASSLKSLTVKATAPSRGTKYRINISSIESTNGSVDLYFQVKLPVTKISVTERLAVIYDHPLEIADKINYSSNYTLSGTGASYEVDEKGVEYSLLTFTNMLNATFTLVTKNNVEGVYYIQNANGTVRDDPAFSIIDGVLTVEDDTLEGTVSVEVLSERYDKTLDDVLDNNNTLSETEKALLRAENDKLKSVVSIEIVKQITFEDISLSSAQYAYDSNGDVKLSGLLYNNSSEATYKIGSSTYSYLREIISLTVQTTQSFEVKAESGSMVKDGVTLLSNISFNVTGVSQTEGTNVSSTTKLLTFSAGNAGTAYIDFIITLTGFSNEISYKFSDLYSEYLDSLTQEEFSQLEDYAKTSKLVLNVSSLPTAVVVEKDNTPIITTESLKIYDSYTTSNGQKFEVSLTSNSGTLSTNKIVRVYLADKALSGEIVSDYFIVRSSTGSVKNLAQTTKNNVTMVYFDLDLSKAEDRYFYIQAKDTDITPLFEGKSFTFLFENLIASKVIAYDGSDVTNSTIINPSKTFDVTTNKGVTEILVKAKIAENYISLDSESASSNEVAYQSLVLKFNSGNADSSAGTLLSYMIEEGLSSNITISCDDKYLTVFEDLQENNSFDGDTSASDYQKFLLSVVGKSLGTTAITFTAENGYAVIVNVKIVNEFGSDIILKANQVYGNNYITQGINGKTGKIENETVSIKNGGAFDLVYTSYSGENAVDRTGVIGLPTYASSDISVANMSQNGKVTAVSEGETTIIITINYFSFENVNGYNQWTPKAVTEFFVLQVFIPTNVKGLSNYSVTVYDYNSLGQNYKSYSQVNVSVKIDSASTIAKAENIVNAVTYENGTTDVAEYLFGDELVGLNFTAYAYIQNLEENYKKVIVTFTISEFGLLTTFDYAINIYRAVKIENIGLSGTDNNGDSLVLNEYAGALSAESGAFVTNVRVGDTLSFYCAINPLEVFESTLTASVYKANANLSLGDKDTGKTFASLTYNSNVNQAEVVTNGNDDFDLNIKSSQSGYFYLIIYANDSASQTAGGEIEYKVCVKVLIEITDGSASHSYVIYDSDDLKDIANEPNSTYTLGANVFISEIWTPIVGFNGVLNGYNSDTDEFYKISGLKLFNIGSENIGLFSQIGSSGAVLNLKVEVSYVILEASTLSFGGDVNVGVIAGTNNGLIMNCSVSFDNFVVAIASNNANIGGMVGTNTGSIYNFSTTLSSNITKSDVTIYEDGKVNTAIDLNNLLGSTPVYGSMKVSDTTAKKVNEGGIAGVNSGYINGLYGVYNYINETQNLTSFTNFQNEFYDVDVKINSGLSTKVGTISNDNSSLGGIVGLMIGGKISNVSATGAIGNMTLSTVSSLKGAKNNVGGIVGIISENSSQLEIENVLASVVVRGKNYVGGVAGRANKTSFYNVRVENYGENENFTLVAGENYVGGVVGSSTNAYYELVYSYSYIDKFNTIYMTYGDVFAFGNIPVAGAVAGYATTNNTFGHATGVFSNFNIMVKETSTGGNVAGLFGLANDGGVDEFSYVGVVSLLGLNSVNAVMNVAGSTDVSTNFAGYYYFYLLQYALVEDTYILVLPSDTETLTYSSDTCDIANIDGYIHYSEDEYVDFSFYEYDNISSIYNINNIIKYGFQYKIDNTSNYYNFLKVIPSAISLDLKGTNAVLQGSDYKLTFATDSVKNYYYDYVLEGNHYLVMTYSVNNNSFDLSDIFAVTPTPSGITKFNLMASSSNTNILSVTNAGKLVVKSAGSVTLTIYIRENSNVKVIVNVIIVNDFDYLLLSASINQTDSYFDTTDSNPLNVAKGSNINVISDLVKKVYSSFSNANSNGQEDFTLSTILNINNYTINYKVLFYNSGTGEYQDVTGNSAYYTKDGQAFIFETEGKYKVQTTVSFVSNTKTYVFTNDAWVFYLNVVAKATYISFVSSEIVLKSTATATVSLLLESKSAMDIVFKVIDENNQDKTYMFDILVTSAENAKPQGKAFGYQVQISLKDDYKNVTELAEYTLLAYDDQECLINYPAILDVVIGPQSVDDVSLVHYAFTKKTSKLVNTVNTETYESPNYSYSFTEESSSYIISGSEGLVVIDLYPYYANISSVVIESGLGNVGEGVKFVQMVQIGSNTSDKYYINGPETTASANGGISLNLVSYVPRDVATLSIGADGQSTMILSASNMSYAFGNESDNPEWGRLYVKTIAPSSLSNDSSFVIKVTITYTSIDSSKDVTQREWKETTTLTVESVPGLSLEVTHDGEEREMIAYTGQDSSVIEDYLTLTPVLNLVGQELKTIAVTVARGNTQIEDASEYVTVSSNNDGTYLLKLGSKAVVGDIITLKLVANVKYDNYTIEKSFIVRVTVVEVVIKSVKIRNTDVNNNVKLTIGTTSSLKVDVEGYGLESALTNAANSIARSMSETGSIRYWYVGINGYESLTNMGVEDYLPFVLQYKELESGESTVKSAEVNSLCLGVSNTQETFSFNTKQQMVVMVAGSDTGSVNMRLAFSYVYKNGAILFIPNYVTDTTYYMEQDFSIYVTQGEQEENLIVVDTVEEFKAMSKNGNYILMANLSFDNYVPINAEFASFDGNNKIITINYFNYETGIASSQSSYSINLGLFDTVSSGTIIKNVIVAFPNNKAENSTKVYESAMDLTNYNSTVNYGGIAAVNYGMITNCDVIAVHTNLSKKSDYVSAVNNYNNTVGTYNYGYIFDYTLYVKTNTQATVNIGGIVGINGSTGIITNSRVGRDEVTLLDVSDDNSVIANEYSYALTSSRIIISVYGAGNVGGFVATNLGSISSSYAKNLQIEVFSAVNGAKIIHTGGFVVTNNGYIYGSYVAGWEEASTATNASDNRKLGGGIFSNGTIAGFVYLNSNYIEDCYSNINLNGSYIFCASTAKVVSDYTSSGSISAFNPISSGFVYEMTDTGFIYTSYSLSKIYGASNLHTYFEGNLQATGESDTDEYLGTIEDCYYLKESGEVSNSSTDGRAWELSDNPVVDTSGTQSAGLNEFVSEDSFNNFCFDTSDDTFENIIENSTGGVWTIYANGLGGYPELISANKVAISCRVTSPIASENDPSININSFSYVENYAIGSSNNPYLIADFDDYNTIFKDVSAQGSLNDIVSSKFTGSIRLINNIEFPSSSRQTVYSTSVEYTSLVDSISIFDGNYLAMYNITLVDSNVGKKSFGLFRDIYDAGVKNLTLGINSVTAANAVTVGGLAGIIVDSNISNIKIVASQTSSGISGKNYVGGLAGIILASNSNENYSVSRIKTNISVTGNSSNLSSSITSSFEIWSDIKPTGATSSSGNLNLDKLDINMNYAGGVVGVVDLRQKSELGDDAANSEPNITNVTVGKMVQSSSITGSINFTNEKVEILSSYAGGLFGFVGTQTYLSNSSFVVSGTSKLISDEVAGGITAINFGTLSKTAVTYDEDDLKTSDLSIVNFVSGGVQTSGVNETLFSGGTPKYIGGIVGINAGNETSGSGRILDSYNRLDVKNTNAIAVGGIVGASYVGELKNVYTTASLMADLDSSEQVYIGGIIGKIFDESTGEYFQEVDTDTSSNNGQSYELNLSYAVALNIWDTDDFDALFNFTELNDNNVIGALYGKYENAINGSQNLGIVSVNDGNYVQQLILDSFDYNYISELAIGEEVFDKTELGNGGEEEKTHYIPLWGVNDTAGLKNYDAYLNGVLCGNGGKNLIYPNKVQNLLGNTTGISSLRNIYFSLDNWLESTWDYSDENLLPLLKYGYESSLIRIYTANQFIEELSSSDTLSKKYIIMNDIDFTGVDLSVFTEPFRGTLSGNAVSIVENGLEYSRYPILFNITFSGTNLTSDFAIFQTTVDATISNLNFVVSSYHVVFSSTVKAETKAGILVANAINTTITDVNIYSSLNDVVSEDISSTSQVLNGKTHYVTRGVRTNELNSVVDYSTAFLQLSTLNPLSEVSVSTSARDLHLKYFFTFTSEAMVSSVLTYTYSLSYSTDNLITEDNRIDLVDIVVLAGEYTSIENRQNLTGMLTNASCVGQFVSASDSSILNISNCSTTLNVSVIYSSINAYKTKYVGAFVGNCIGNMKKMFTSSDISITCDYAINLFNGDADIFYAGGAVGRMQGSMESIFAENVTVNIGSSSRNILTTNTGSGGLFIGGMVGAAGEFVTMDSGTRVTGIIEEMEIEDLVMNVYVQGKSVVAGVVGQNRYNIVNLTIKQSSLNALSETLNVYVGESDSSCYVGGVLGENLANELSNVYTNMSINVQANFCESLYVGGIVAVLTKSCSFVNVINDADCLNVSRVKTNGTYVTSNLAVGGITGGLIGSNASTITLNKVLTTMDIVCDQEKSMFVGGAVGKAETISVSNVIVLGDLTLNRGNGSKSGSYFYTDSDTDEDYYYYIGGLVGMYSKYVCGENDGSTLVASTIRDYAIAQKLNLNIGSVVGRENVNNSISTDTLVSHKNSKKTYYNENISLVNCDTYVNDEFTGVAQSELMTVFQSIYKDIMIKSDGFESIYNSEYFSKLHTSYFTGNGVITDITNSSNYILGSKISPITFVASTVLANDTYYILKGDITLSSSITTTATGWVFNGQGYSAVGTNVPLFMTITENSVVCAVFSTLNSSNATGLSAYAPIAKDNYGFVFSCGTSGTITGLVGENNGGRTGLIHTNYGVISTCFSIASITASSGAGIVLNNGKDNANKLGNIYNTYFTGEVNSAQGANIGSYFSGFTINSKYGTISNCYTMADVNAENQKVAPIAYLEKNDTSENIYRTYYDYLPNSFIFLDTDGKTQINQEGVNANLLLLTNENINCIQSKGFYVYSYSLSGETADSSYVNVNSLFSTHWIIPNENNSSSTTSSDSELILLFKKSEKYSSNETLKIDSTWFNYAYVTKNYKNVILTSELDDYFDMIYTGNGLADSTNVNKKTNTFTDMPYMIKHSGMLEMFMLINYLKTSPEYKYYIFTKNINFEKYSGDMYWSKHLDEKSAYFVGDLDGNEKIVYNMYSSNGLLRALPNIANVNSGTDTRNTIVHDITFTSCYAQTGLVAGYMGNGILSGIDVDSTISSIGGDSYVYNGDLSNIVQTGLFTETGLFDDRISSVVINFSSLNISSITRSVTGSDIAFAGGLIGYMEGGEISTTAVVSGGETSYIGAEFMGLFVMVNDTLYTYESYAGGLVGVMVGGKIYGTESAPFKVQGISVYSCLDNGVLTDEDDEDITRPVSSSNIGGVVGLLSTYVKIAGELSYITVESTSETSSVGLFGFYTVGGIVGYNDGGKITNCVYDAVDEINVSQAYVSKNEFGIATITKLTVSENKSMRNLVANEIYIGGISGRFKSGLIENCSYGQNASFEVTVKYLGGYHTVLFGGIVSDIYQSSNNTAIINNCYSVGRATVRSVKDSIVGGIVGRMRGGTLTNCNTGYYLDSAGNLVESQNSKFVSSIYFNLDQFSWITPGLIDSWEEGISTFSDLWNSYWKNKNWLSGTLTYYPTDLTVTKNYSDLSSNGQTGGYTSSSMGGTFSSYGYSVTGGIVGKMHYGTLDGSSTTEGEYTIFNNATIEANSSAGGIVGEVIVTQTDGSKKANIINVKNTGDVKALSTFDISADMDINSSLYATNAQSYIKETSVVLDMLLKADFYISLKESKAGGIVGYVYSSISSSVSGSIVKIDKCVTEAEVIGCILSTFVGGIVGLSADATNNDHILISQCESSASYLGYPLNSFAGGIVGYSNFSTIINCETGSWSAISIISGGVKTTLTEKIEEFMTGDEDAMATDIVNMFSGAETFLSTPYILGGVVGYLQNGLVQDCNTNVGLMMASRVAGGMIGVMAGGILKSTEIMINKSAVFALSGIAGGIVGLMRGGAISTEISLENSSLISELVGVFSKMLTNGGDLASLLLESNNGIIINSITGVILGYASGGIIGYFENMNSIKRGVIVIGEPELAGVINLGSAVSGVGMLLAANKVAESAGADISEGVDWLSNLGNWVRNTVDKFIGKWSIAIEIDGQQVVGLSTDFLKCFSTNMNNLFTFALSSLDFRTAGYEINEYLSKIIVPKYKWTADDGLCYPDTEALMKSENFVIDEKDFVESIGQGACGGIIGIVKTSSTLTLNAVISYAATLTSSTVTAQSLFSIASGRIASAGTAGGLVGACFKASDSGDPELIISFAFNFTSVLGRESAGGIVGYAEESTYIYSGSELSVGDYISGAFISNGFIRGWVANYGAVSADGNAGGIIGYSVGANLNTKEVENLYSPHLIQVVGSAGKFASDAILASEISQNNTKLCPYIISSGNISGARRSGGIVGYATGDTCMYFCKTTLSPLAMLTGEDFIWGELLKEMSIAGSQFVGGLVGEMLDSGIISGTCYVGSRNSNFITRLFKVTIYGFKESGDENESFAGGIAGKVSSQAKIGGLIGNPDTNTTYYVHVADNVHFGASSSTTSLFQSFYPAYVGGSIGLVENDLPDDYYVEIACIVSGGEIAVGGWFGMVDLGKAKTLDMSKMVNGIAVKTATNSTLEVNGTTTLLSPIILIDDNFEEAVAVGGVVGYLKSGTLTGVSVNHSVSGQKGNIVGGVVGKLGADGTISNVSVYPEELTELDYSTLVSGSKVTNKTVENNALALGGLVGYMEGGYLLSSFVSKVILSGAKYVGGVVGYMKSGTIGSNSVVVEGGEVGTATYGGGVVGYLEGTDCIFERVISKGVNVTEQAKAVITEGADYAGGFVGYMNGGVFDFNLTESSGMYFFYNDLKTVYGKYIAGGFVGEMANGSIQSGSLTDINIITGTESNDNNIIALGGLVGKMTGGTIDGGTAPTTLSGNNIGGIVGWMTSRETTDSDGGNITTTGTINGGTVGVVIATGDNSYAGGYVGRMDAGTINSVSKSDDSRVANNINSKNVSLGGVVGIMTGGTINSAVEPVSVIASGSLDSVYGGGVVGELAVKAENTNDNRVVFDFQIAELQTNVSGVYYGGALIGKASDGKISSVAKEGSVVTATYAGGIIGYAGGAENYSVIINVDEIKNVTLNGKTAVGGAIGYADEAQVVLNKSIISVNGTFTATDSTGYVGGLVGMSVVTRIGPVGYEKEDTNTPTTTIDLVKFSATIDLKNVVLSTNGRTVIGGIIGEMQGGSAFALKLGESISANLTVDGDGILAFGGIVGNNAPWGTGQEEKFGIIYCCENQYEILLGLGLDSDSYLGGICGMNGGYIYNSINSASITSDFANIGGIVGANTGSIEYCANTSEGSIIATNKSFVGGIVGVSADEGKVTTNCSNFANLSLGEGSSNSIVDSSLWEDNSSSKIVCAETGDETTYNASSNFSSAYSGAVGGIAGKITDTSYVSGANQGQIFGYYYYGFKETATSVNFGGGDIEEINTYEIVDRRGNIVGWNANSVESGAKANNEVIQFGTLGAWTTDTVTGVKVFSWADRQGYITNEGKEAQVGYVIEVVVTSYTSQEYVEDGVTKYRYPEFGFSKIYNLMTISDDNDDKSWENLMLAYNAIDKSTYDSIINGINSLNLSSSNGTELYLQSMGTVYSSKISSLEVKGLSVGSSSSVNYTPEAGDDVKKVETKFNAYKVISTYYDGKYSTLAFHDCGGDISFARDVYKKENYVTDLSSKSMALEKLYELDNVATSEDVLEPEWTKASVPQGVLFLYNVYSI